MSHDRWHIARIHILRKLPKFSAFFYRYDVNCLACSFRDTLIFCGTWFTWRFITFSKTIGYRLNVGNPVWLAIVFAWLSVWRARWGNNASLSIFSATFSNDILHVDHVFLFNGVFSVVNNEIGIFTVSWGLRCRCWTLRNLVCTKRCIFFLICIMGVSFRLSWNICDFVTNR